jgi:hypothetical protein
MARGLRHEDPRCGREHFDLRAGLEWEWGPYANETTYSVPDEPWYKYARTLTPANKLLFANERWAVTKFNLEPLYEGDEWPFLGYEIPAHRLLSVYPNAPIYYWPLKVTQLPWEYFASFEEAFRKALQLHCWRRSTVVDNEMLERTFRRVRAIARKRKSS